MYGLELVVNDGNLNEVWDTDGVVVNEVFDVSDEVGYGGMNGWHKDGILDGGASYPILGMAVFSWCLAFATYSLHQHLMDHTDES